MYIHGLVPPSGPRRRGHRMTRSMHGPRKTVHLTWTWVRSCPSWTTVNYTAPYTARETGESARRPHERYSLSTGGGGARGAGRVSRSRSGHSGLRPGDNPVQSVRARDALARLSCMQYSRREVGRLPRSVGACCDLAASPPRVQCDCPLGAKRGEKALAPSELRAGQPEATLRQSVRHSSAAAVLRC